MPMNHRPDSRVYGPVASRRLGLSLGVVLVPFKACSFDCLYCQVGRTTRHRSRRWPYVRADEVVPQVAERLRSGMRPDFITMGGSGEPTLNSNLGEIIRRIRALTDVRIAVLTNGSTLGNRRVRADCRLADVVLPNLDAGDEATFRRINRPCPGITLEGVVAGLAAFRRGFEGEIWLEVFLVRGLNDTQTHVRRIAALAKRLRPDRIQLNTAVRPTADPAVRGVAPERMAALGRLFKPRAEVVAAFSRRQAQGGRLRAGDVIVMLRRRPCTAGDVAAGLGTSVEQVRRVLRRLCGEGRVRARRQGGRTYYGASE